MCVYVFQCIKCVCVCVYASCLYVCDCFASFYLVVCCFCCYTHTHTYAQQGKSIMRILDIEEIVFNFMSISVHFTTNNSFSYILHKKKFTCHSQHLPNLKWKSNKFMRTHTHKNALFRLCVYVYVRESELLADSLAQLLWLLFFIWLVFFSVPPSPCPHKHKRK